MRGLLVGVRDGRRGVLAVWNLHFGILGGWGLVALRGMLGRDFDRNGNSLINTDLEASVYHIGSCYPHIQPSP